MKLNYDVSSYLLIFFELVLVKHRMFYARDALINGITRRYHNDQF